MVRSSQLAPSRKLEEFADALDAGHVTSGEEEFASNYRKVHDSFSSQRMRGRPIVVAENVEGPFTILEGYTRLTTITSLQRAGRQFDHAIPVCWAFVLAFGTGISGAS